MKIEKLTFYLCVALLVLGGTHRAAAASTITTMTTITTDDSGKKKILQKKTKIAKSKKTNLRKIKNIGLAKNKKGRIKPRQTYHRPNLQANNVVRPDSTVENFEKYGTLDKPHYLPNTSTTKVISEVKKETKPVFSGNVEFTVGKDSNIDPDKTDIKGNFFQIAPKLSFERGHWSGAFGATIKDYSDQVQSDLFKQNEATAEFTYKALISPVTTSTTTLSGRYHDERWPDYINYDGGYDSEGLHHSMPIRYNEAKILQQLGFNFGNISLDIGGSALHRDNSNLDSDYARDIRDERRFEKDYNELAGFGKLTLSAAKFLDLSAKPSVKQTKYTDREGRQPDGSAGGTLVSAPKYELLTSEIGLDVAFKFGESNITPTTVIGQVSDQARGAEDNAYYGFGLNSSLVLDRATKLTLEPNVMYKKIQYDNWTSGITPGQKRVDDEVSAGVKASIMFRKNFGGNIAYNFTEEKSNKFADTSENYREEVLSSSLIFSF